MEKYIHNKTGKMYCLVQNHLLFKTITFTNVQGNTYAWDKNLDKQIVLYKALYDNPDGPYFVRYADDFFKNFTKYEEIK